MGNSNLSLFFYESISSHFKKMRFSKIFVPKVIQ